MFVAPHASVSRIFKESGEMARLSFLTEEIRKCVHCGMCNATCPTYQITGDELDGPRGRIYQIKNLIENEQVEESQREHLDRCLQCRSCETTCPSGVQYHQIYENGRWLMRARIGTSLGQTLQKTALSAMASRPLSNALWRTAQSVRAILPHSLQQKIPAPRRAPLPSLTAIAPPINGKLYGLFQGCVQPGLAPEINHATQKLLQNFGITFRPIKGEQCCGALPYHLDRDQQAIAQIKNNLQVWADFFAAAPEAQGILINASGCALMVAEYPEVLARHRFPQSYIAHAQSICAKIIDPLVLLQEYTSALKALLRQRPAPARRIVFQSPCTLQHGCKQQGKIESWFVELFRNSEVQLIPLGESHLCCGSAGVYSVLQPTLSNALRQRKWDHLLATKPDRVLSANIGCINHLQAHPNAQTIAVEHYVNFLAQWIDSPTY